MKKRKIILMSLAVTIAILCGFFSVNQLSDLKVYAKSNVLSVEQYTDSDYLLKADGSLSSKNIERFAEEVKAGKSTYYPELTEVIPRQYLESQDESATFAYNGKEYGFYVAKNEENFDFDTLQIEDEEQEVKLYAKWIAK